MASSVAMLPPAPVRFSTKNDWRRCSDIHLAITREVTSAEPPAAKPTSKRTGRAGYVSASAARETPDSSKPDAAPKRVRRDSFIEFAIIGPVLMTAAVAGPSHGGDRHRNINS